MSNPSFSNIDLWLFELAEGNLTQAQIEQLESFLLRNPELDVDRDVWEMANVGAVNAVYPDQEKLKRRKPIGWYSVLGGTAVIALIGLGGFVYNQSVIATENIIANQNSDALVKIKLIKEINELKAKYESIRSKTLEDSNDSSEKISDHKAGDELNRSENGQLPDDLNSSDGNFSRSASSVNKLKASANSTNTNANSYNTVDPSTTTGINGEIANVNSDEIQMLAPENEKERQLVTQKVREVDVLNSSKFADVANKRIRTSGFSSVEYKMSLKAKWNRLTRSMQNMMDNPIALKNFRDPYYHVPGMLPADVNFSAAGTLLSTRVQASTRLQWYGEENEQIMSQLAIDGYAYGMRGGIGLQINHAMYNDGGMNIANVALTYSPKLSITKSISFEPSVRFKMGNKSINKKMMTDIAQVELDRGNAHSFYGDGDGPTGNDLWYKDLGAGLMVNTEWFFAGFQVDNLFRHRDNIYSKDLENPRRADHHFVGTIGTDWVSRKENWSVSPYMVYQNMESLSEAWLGLNVRVNWFTIGGAISSNLEPSGSIGMKFDHFALTYNADYTRSVMTEKSALSHQLTLRFVSKPSRFGKRLLNL